MHQYLEKCVFDIIISYFYGNVVQVKAITTQIRTLSLEISKL